MGQVKLIYFNNYKPYFNYTFNIRLNKEAQSSKYFPGGLGSKYWAGLTLIAMMCSYLHL